MEFWGVEVKPGQSLKVQPEDCKLIHISQASLGEFKEGKGPKNVTLHLKIDGKDFVIGSLASEERSQLMFDLVFEKEFELSHGWKNGSVYFLGYIADDQVSDGDDEFSDLPEDESEDELVAAPENGDAKPKPEIVAAAKKATGATKEDEPASDEDEDGSDSDDDEDDVDSDNLMESSDEEELPQKVQPPKKRPAESPKNAAPGKKAKPEQKGSPFASKNSGGKPQQGGNKKPQQGGNNKPQQGGNKFNGQKQGGNKFNGQKGKAGGQRRS